MLRYSDVQVGILEGSVIDGSRDKPHRRQSDNASVCRRIARPLSIRSHGVVARCGSLARRANQRRRVLLRCRWVGFFYQEYGERSALEGLSGTGSFW